MQLGAFMLLLCFAARTHHSCSLPHHPSQKAFECTFFSCSCVCVCWHLTVILCSALFFSFYLVLFHCFFHSTIARSFTVFFINGEIKTWTHTFWLHALLSPNINRCHCARHNEVPIFFLLLFFLFLSFVSLLLFFNSSCCWSIKSTWFTFERVHFECVSWSQSPVQ